MFLEMCQRRHIYFMAKEELFHNKLSAWLFGNQLGAFPVRRGKGDTGAIDTAKSIVESGKMLGFSRGTRSRDGKLGRGKSGAALIVSQTGAEVLPACIVTKDQHVRLFRRSKVVFGPPISLEELLLRIRNIRICATPPADHGAHRPVDEEKRGARGTAGQVRRFLLRRGQSGQHGLPAARRGKTGVHPWPYHP